MKAKGEGGSRRPEAVGDSVLSPLVCGAAPSGLRGHHSYWNNLRRITLLIASSLETNGGEKQITNHSVYPIPCLAVSLIYLPPTSSVSLSICDFLSIPG